MRKYTSLVTLLVALFVCGHTSGRMRSELAEHNARIGNFIRMLPADVGAMSFDDLCSRFYVYQGTQPGEIMRETIVAKAKAETTSTLLGKISSKGEFVQKLLAKEIEKRTDITLKDLAPVMTAATSSADTKTRLLYKFRELVLKEPTPNLVEYQDKIGGDCLTDILASREDYTLDMFITALGFIGNPSSNTCDLIFDRLSKEKTPALRDIAFKSKTRSVKGSALTILIARNDSANADIFDIMRSIEVACPADKAPFDRQTLCQLSARPGLTADERIQLIAWDDKSSRQ